MRPLKTPPTEPRPDELVFTRAMRAPNFTIYLPDGDSYKATVDEAKLYLKLLGCVELVADDILRRLWNFYAVWVSTISWEIDIVAKGAVEDVFGSKSRFYMPVVGSLVRG